MPLNQLKHFLFLFIIAEGLDFANWYFVRKRFWHWTNLILSKMLPCVFPWNFANKFALVHFFYLQKSFIDHSSLSLIFFFLWNTNSFFLCQTFDFLPCFSWSKLIIIRIFVARDTPQFATDRSLHNNLEHWSL